MIFRIDRRLFSDSCISKVVYWLSGQYAIDRHIDGDEEIITIEGGNDKKLKEEFFEKLNDYKLREVIETETKDIRTVLYAKAFGDFDDITEEEITE